MNNPTQHIEKHAREIRLTSAERVAMREHLERHMLEHPLRPIVSPYMRYFQAPAFAFAALFLVVLGGGSVLGANSSLPGGFLYPLKVGVVEPLQGSFQFSPQAQAQWQVELASTRLDEAMKLDESNSLKGESAITASVQVAQASTDAASAVAHLNTINPAAAKKVASALDASLDSHAGTLAALESDATSSSSPVISALVAYTDSHRSRSRGAGIRAGAVIKAAPMIPAPTPTPEVHTFSATTMSAPATTTITATTSASADTAGQQDHYTHALELFSTIHAIAGDEGQ